MRQSAEWSARDAPPHSVRVLLQTEDDARRRGAGSLAFLEQCLAAPQSGMTKICQQGESPGGEASAAAKKQQQEQQQQPN